MSADWHIAPPQKQVETSTDLYCRARFGHFRLRSMVEKASCTMAQTALQIAAFRL
jgi:hypothetical protein